MLACVEVHKRWDQIYVDARDKIANLGPFGFMHSYMSQPKHQLETFRAWAGKSSDISFYLNSHHIDFHEWAVGQSARPSKVTAMASTGVAKERFDIDDTITLTVEAKFGGDGHWVSPVDAADGQVHWYYCVHFLVGGA